MNYGGFFDYNAKKIRLAEVEKELENPDIWSNQELAQELSRQKKQLEGVTTTLDRLGLSIDSCSELYEMATGDNYDEDTLLAIKADLDAAKDEVDRLEFRRMFSHPMDPNNCFIDMGFYVFRRPLNCQIKAGYSFL